MVLVYGKENSVCLMICAIVFQWWEIYLFCFSMDFKWLWWAIYILPCRITFFFNLFWWPFIIINENFHYYCLQLNENYTFVDYILLDIFHCTNSILNEGRDKFNSIDNGSAIIVFLLNSVYTFEISLEKKS